MVVVLALLDGVAKQFWWAIELVQLKFSSALLTFLKLVEQLIVKAKTRKNITSKKPLKISAKCLG